MDGVALNDHLTSAVQTVQPRGLSGNLFGSDGGKEVPVLKPAGEIAAPVDGVTLTGIGYADGSMCRCITRTSSKRTTTALFLW